MVKKSPKFAIFFGFQGRQPKENPYVFLQKRSKTAKISPFGGFQRRETRENPYILALIQGLCKPKVGKNRQKFAILVVSKTAKLRKTAIGF